MGSIWSLDGADIYVDEDSGKDNSQTAEINPINAVISTFHHIFDRSPERTIVGTVIGKSYLSDIKDTKGNEVTLITDLELGGYTVLVQDVTHDRQLVVCQTVDTTQARTAPVYRVTVLFRVI